MLTTNQQIDRFARAEALHLLALRYHCGQWSRGYRLLCKLWKCWRFKPAFNANPELLEGKAREYYKRWEPIARRTF